MPELSPETLKGLGLSEAEARVYLAALELGQASIQDLSKKSGVKRTSIYHFLDDLKDRKLIFETSRKKRKVYSAAKPYQLLELGRIRLAEVQSVMPELMALYNKSDQKPRVTFYEGIDGIKEVYADTLNEKKPIIAWSDFEHMYKMLGQGYVAYYPPIRAHLNIPFQTIVRDSVTAREAAKENRKLLREMKFLSAGDLKTEINIYGNKVALMSFRSKPPFAVLIEDHDVAETLRVAWRALWDRLK